MEYWDTSIVVAFAGGDDGEDSDSDSGDNFSSANDLSFQTFLLYCHWLDFVI